MAFKLDPVSALGAIQKAKSWQQQSSPMSFSSGLVSKDPTVNWDGRVMMDEIPRIITPESHVFTNDATNVILGDHIDQYTNAAELGMQALGLRGDVARAERQYEFAKELAEKRKKAARKKKGGIGGFLSGALSGASAGASFGPWGAVAGGVLGGASSLFG